MFKICGIIGRSKMEFFSIFPVLKRFNKIKEIRKLFKNAYACKSTDFQAISTKNKYISGFLLKV